MQGIGQFVRRHYDIITPASLFFLTTVSVLSWMPSFIGVPRDVLVIAVSPVLTTIGVFMAYRLNEKVKNPKLRIVQWGKLIVDKHRHTARIFAEVENSAGREVARDARATITIKKIDKDRGEMNIDSSDLATNLANYERFLVSDFTPRFEGELIAWMVPEMPYNSKAFYGIELTHITNIGPGQRNRAIILDVLCLKDEQNERSYYLRVFSEYGTEKVNIPTGLPPPNEFMITRIVRCILKPGIYKF
jgi:hypothetical protein